MGTPVVLCVDDEVMVLTSLESALKKAFGDEIALEFAENANDGLEILNELLEDKEQIAMVISDYIMPGMKGDEFLKKVHELSSNTLKILLTGQADLEGVINVINDAKLYRYIGKPWDSHDLMMTVKSALEKYRQDELLEIKTQELEQSNQELLVAKIDLEKINQNLEGLVAQRTEELHREHNMLKEAQGKLVLSEKMAGLGTMVAGAAHELNNPNNFVSAGVGNLKINLEQFEQEFFKLLEAEGDEINNFFKEKLRPVFQDLESIKIGSQRIHTIVKGLRTFSRLDEAEFKKVNIVESLKSAINLVQANYREQVEILEDFQFEPEFACWPAELNQAFMNIMNNGCQAIVMNQEQKNSPQPGQLKICSTKLEDILEICFQDNGCGMNQEIQDKIFEPFFTTRDIGEGTGLGLAIVFGIIEKHKGKIEVESTVEQGTKVTLLLPLAL